MGKRAKPAGRGAAEGSIGGPDPRPGEVPTRKNHYLDQSKIDLAKKILGVKTETEALDGALDLLIYGETLALGTEAMVGEEYHDGLGIAGEIPDDRAGG